MITTIAYVLRWIMVILSFGGALFVTSTAPFRRLLGFIFWTISNTYWALDGFMRDDPSMGSMYVAFQCFNIMGVYNNFKAWRNDE